MFRPLLVAALLSSVLAVDALCESAGFHVQQEYDYSPGEWEEQFDFRPAVITEAAERHDPQPPHPPHFPGHRPPRSTNSTIYTFLSEDPEFSKVFKAVNFSDEIVSLLNDTSTNVTFFALPNSAIPKKPPHRRHRHHLSSRSVYEDFTLLDIISALESAEDGGNGLAENQLDEERLKKIVTAILSYHIVNDKLGLAELSKNTTYATRLSHVFGALKDEPLRLRFGPGLPFAHVNYYSQVIIPDISAANGVIHAVNRPLLPPPSAFQTFFLLQQQFSIFTSAAQRSGLTDAIDYRIIPESSGNSLATTEGSPVVTTFVPSNKAFSRLPRRLQFFLFSPFGERALKKLLQYHTVPDIALFTDWVLNATSDAILDKSEIFNGMATLQDAMGHAYDYFDAPSPLPLRLGPLPVRSKTQYYRIGGVRGMHWGDASQAPEHIATDLPCCKVDFMAGGYKTLLEDDDDHRPPGWHLPKPEIVGNYTLPTALDDHSLNVLVVKIPIRLPLPGKGEVVHHLKKVVVNGQATSSYDGVALNGALHVVDKLISPRKKHDHEHQPREFEVDDWEDWEEWLPQWAEN